MNAGGNLNLIFKCFHVYHQQLLYFIQDFYFHLIELTIDYFIVSCFYFYLKSGYFNNLTYCSLLLVS